MLTGVIDPAGGAAATPSASMVALCEPKWPQVGCQSLMQTVAEWPGSQLRMCLRRSISPIRYAIEAFPADLLRFGKCNIQADSKACK